MQVSPFEYSDTNKRYHTLSYYIKNKFGRKVYKALINGGFTCPNIDGKCSVGGCTYCYDGGGEFSLSPDICITQQLNDEKERINKKYGNVSLIAYFQAHTNTYAPLSKLKEVYEPVLSDENVVGISIATRADCIDDEILNYLSRLSEKTYLTVELGLQTVHDITAQRINRGHDFSAFERTFKKLKQNGIRVCVHMIDGLPGESFDMMIKSFEVLGNLKPDAVKIHSLHIMKDTAIEKQYNNNEFRILTRNEYIEIVCNQLELLPSEIVIERITGDGAKSRLVAPEWSKDKIAVLGGIDKFLYDNNMYQGRKTGI